MVSAALSISLLREIVISRSLTPRLRYVSMVAALDFLISLALGVNSLDHVPR